MAKRYVLRFRRRERDARLPLGLLADDPISNFDGICSDWASVVAVTSPVSVCEDGDLRGLAS